MDSSSIASLTVSISTANHSALSASSSTLALSIKGPTVAYAPNGVVEADISKRIVPPASSSSSSASGFKGNSLTLVPIIRAFRAQLEASFPQLCVRKWALFCSFDGYSRAGESGSSPSSPLSKALLRRPIPPFRIDLPSEITSQTPQMTPAHSTEHTALHHLKADDRAPSSPTKEASLSALENSASDQSLDSLLGQFVSLDTRKALVWAVKFSVVIGEDEEEERVKREKFKAMATSAAPTMSPTGPLLSDTEFSMMYRMKDRSLLGQPFDEDLETALQTYKRTGRTPWPADDPTPPTGGLFGNPSGLFQPPTFGKSATPLFQPPQGFQPSQSLFGNATPSQGLFNATPFQGAFGGPAPTSQGLFAASSQSLFANATPSGGLFGNAVPSQGSLFGGPSPFGSAPQPNFTFANAAPASGATPFAAMNGSLFS